MGETRETVEDQALRELAAKARLSSEKYSRAAGYVINPDEEIASAVFEGLARNRQRYGLPYCPCAIVTGDRQVDHTIICPCAAHKEDIARDGMCHCALYIRP